MRRDAGALLEAWGRTLAVDHHCHPLRRSTGPLEAAQLRAGFSEAYDPGVHEQHTVHTAAYRGAIRRIAAELGCEPSEGAVLEARNHTEFVAHARRLLKASRTGTMLLDYGLPDDQALGQADHTTLLPIQQREVVRVERVAEELAGSCASLGEWLEAVRERLGALLRAGAAGLKTITAYRASLRLRHWDASEAQEAFVSFHARALGDPGARLHGDVLCHCLLFETARVATALEVPLQVHCGLGDPDEDLGESSPLGLRPLLVDDRFEGLRLALLHCYPYHREAAYLCAVHGQVFMDLSLAIPLAAVDGARALAETLGLCPWSKLLYATDATRLPEVYLVAAEWQRQALAEALGELVERGLIDRDEAVEAGRSVLAENATRLYQLAS